MSAISNFDSEWLLPISAPTAAALASKVQQWETLAGGAERRKVGHELYRTALVMATSSPPVIPEPAEPLPDRGKMVFVFGGQRTLRCGPGILRLMQREPVFRAVLEECSEVIQQADGWSLLHELCQQGDDYRLDSTSPYCQPALYAIEVGVSRLLKSWGIVPDAVAGLSAGTSAVVCEAGAVSLCDGLTLALRRGKLLHELAPMGRMMAVFRTPENVQDALQRFPGLSIATYAGPELTVLSGPDESVLQFSSQLDEEGEFFVRLGMDRQLHHPSLAPLAGPMRAALGPIVPTAPSVPMLCTIKGQWATGDILRDDYWWRSILQPVDLVGAVRQLLEDGYRTFVEISADPGIYFPMQQTADQQGTKVAMVSTLTEGEDERGSLLTTVVRLFEAGWDADFEAIRGRGVPAAAS